MTNDERQTNAKRQTLNDKRRTETMHDEPTTPPSAPLPSTALRQIATVEPILNALAAQGLQVRRLPSGAWCWEWMGHTGVATGWGSAITEAVYWYAGWTPDASATRTEEP